MKCIKLGSSARTYASIFAMAAALATPATALAAATVASDYRATPAIATKIGPTSSSKLVTVAIILPSRDPAGLASFVAHVSKPGDRLFHHYVTPAQFAKRYGAQSGDYAALVAWAKAQGLTAGEEYSAHTVLPVSGTVKDLEAAFQLQFVDYKDAKGRVFYAADRAPQIPEALAAKITSVIGFNDAVGFAPLAAKLPAGTKSNAAGSGPLGGYFAADLRTAYTVPAAPRGAPSETLAVFEQGGFDPADVTTYLTTNGLKNKPLVVRGVNGYGGGINSSDVELEAVLDIDMEIGINPNLKKVLVYEDGQDPFGVALVASFAAIASDNKAQTISVSYGIDEALQDPTVIRAENTTLQQEAAQGQTVFASAGDNGAYGDEGDGQHVADPSTQPLITAVGGTTLFTLPGGLRLGESVWNELAQGGGATGGGISSVWPIPAWQAPGGNSVATANGGSATMRNVPDVSAVGDPFTGVAVYSAMNGGWVLIGGTSASSPIWAGFTSVENTISKAFGLGQIGFANPVLYIVGSQYILINDVKDGSNGNPNTNYGVPGFFAGPWYDNASGWGSPNYNTAGNWLSEIISDTNPPPPPTGLKATPGSTDVTVSWTPANGATGYIASAATFPELIPSGFPAFSVGNSAKIQGLTPGTQYYIAINSISPSGYNSNLLIVTTKAAK